MGSLSDPVTTESESSRIYESRLTRRPLTDKIKFASYLSGYVDGEGCFSVSLNPRKQLKTGWEIRPSFSVSQNADRSSFLYEMKQYFQCGTIRPDRSDKTLKYEVRSLRELNEIIIPHFENNPLRSEKQSSFILFSKICQMMSKGDHKSLNSIKEILSIAQEINNGKRKYQSLKKI